ncbi:MAG TPA: hypothetical protein PKD75_06540 [Tepidiformaceae bacterium]|nr:hypothetical protein [Tepidiformaceae bacterium]
MTATLLGIESHWNWRVSAWFRVGSLASLWLLAIFMSPLAWLWAPLAAFRSVLSLVQTVLNVRLGRNVALEGPSRIDWALVGAVFVGAYLAAGVTHLTGAPLSFVLLVPMLVPFSALQVRMVARSFAAAFIADVRPAALARLEDYRRLDRGELRAA